jgi:hypothetical protein
MLHYNIRAVEVKRKKQVIVVYVFKGLGRSADTAPPIRNLCSGWR